MTAKHGLGDVDLGDYLKMVSTKRRWRRMRSLVTAGACFLAFAAGRFGPWPGSHSDRLTLQEAMALLDSPETASWSDELASAAIFRHVYRGIEELQRLSGQEGQASTDASIYLGSLAEVATDGFLRAAEHPLRRPVLDDQIRRLRKAVTK